MARELAEMERALVAMAKKLVEMVRKLVGMAKSRPVLVQLHRLHRKKASSVMLKPPSKIIVRDSFLQMSNL